MKHYFRWSGSLMDRYIVNPVASPSGEQGETFDD